LRDPSEGQLTRRFPLEYQYNNSCKYRARGLWKESLSLDGTADSTYEVPLGALLAAGVKDDGFRSMELIATSLAGCTAMDVISILSKKKQKVSAFEVIAHAERADQHPKVFTCLEIEYIVRGKNISKGAIERAVQLSANTYCPAQAMFKQIVPIELKIAITE